MKVACITILLAMLLTLAGCSATQIHRLTDEKFTPKPPGTEIDIYIGELKRPYREIAVLDSRCSGTKDSEIKEQQLEDIKRLARKVGADAVHNVRLLTKNARGMVPDQRVPFPAFKQGRYKLYFIRGDAITFVDDAETTATTDTRNT